MVSPMNAMQYDAYIEQMRLKEFPMLKDSLYLDHAGTTLYSKSLLDRFSADMMSNLYGNPHSASQASQRSTQQVEDIRLQLLRFFGADPDDFDLVFVANATAGIKLVADAVREHDSGFWYGYHKDAHTSIVGVRELAKEHRCFGSDSEVEDWVSDDHPVDSSLLRLFAYPAQSNMNGRRLPLGWCQGLKDRNILTLLDAAALVSTSPLDLSDVGTAPDFVVLSLYKIFGFPDLGALIVRKDAAWVLQKRKYFGGGTVDMVVSLKEQWHAKKSGNIHEQLEDGTLPIHSIIALKSALSVHRDLFGTLERVSEHTSLLAKRLYESLKSLHHRNGEGICQIYKDPTSTYGDKETQGPVVAFNLRDSRGVWVSNIEVEKLAHIRNINIRTGGLCNPGGIASSLGLSPWQMKENFSSGQRCGSGTDDIMGGKPTGMIRASLGAMSTTKDVDTFVAFISEFFLDSTLAPPTTPSPTLVVDPSGSQLYVESLTVYPIKSCAGWSIPYDTPWEVRPEGLAWDREWCIVHAGTGTALSQKKHPRMALIRPALDFETGVLRISCVAHLGDTVPVEVTVPLSADPRCFAVDDARKTQQTNVCGDTVASRAYTSPEIANFLSTVLGVPCQLARFPSTTLTNGISQRHAKAHLQGTSLSPYPLHFSNESPILGISRASLNRLNESIKARGGKAASPAVFRANIVIAQSPLLAPGQEQPYTEDTWTALRVGTEAFDVLGPCRRCHMLCVDQNTAEKNEEPFVTLAKTRRFGGRVLFGVHMALVKDARAAACSMVRAGDVVMTV